VGLGGNTDESSAALARARAVLVSLLDEPQVSGLYRTAPQLDSDQADFYNAVVTGGWSGTAESLLERLLMLEAGEGRVRDPGRPKGPRVLDLDLLLFGDLIRVSPRLTVPHSGLASRRFALEPLVSLEPGSADPRDGRAWAVVLAALPPQGVDLTARTW
jgi:2-amino-4-hydroxy-6-hydroxymethyldihydropteridine diphosphokinase